MIHPTWLPDTLAVVMIATSFYCVARLVAAKIWGRTIHRDTNVAHASDGVAMAGMLVGAFHTLPTGLWEVVFGALTLWFGVRGARFVVRYGRAGAGSDHSMHLSHYLSHLIMAGAMLYMFLQGSPTSTNAGAATMSAMGGSGSRSDLTELTLLLAVLLIWSAIWHADGSTRYTTARRALVGAGVTGTTDPAPPPSTDPAPDTNGSLAADDLAADHPIADHLTAPGDATDQAGNLAPRLEMACHIVICFTMAYMLILLL
jgi:hypothetical protein